MNVQLENLADQTALIRVKVEEADYAEKVDKTLRTHKRKAQIPGFRPGMVPMGIINKMYRKGAVADQTYRSATDEAFKYVKENKIDIIGDMMPAKEQPELNFDTDKDFEFVFHVGLAPEVAINLTKEDKIEKFVITPSQEMIEGYRNNFLKRFGKLVDVEKIENDEAVNVTFTNEQMSVEDAYIGLISMSEDKRAPFIGKVVGDKMEVNVTELYPDPKQLAAVLSLNDQELAELNPNFTIEITNIRAFRNPELNEEFFAMAYPDGSIKDEAAFNADIVAKVNAELAQQTEFKVVEQARDYMLSKFNLSLPEQFLKDWLFQINEGKFTMEDIEKEFPAFLEMMRWDLIKRAVAMGDGIQISEEDAVAEAKDMALMQFRYYGMMVPAEDMLENYAKQILSKEEEAKKIYERVGERKVVNAIMDKVTVETKEMSIDEFSAMVQPAGVESAQ